VGDGERVAKRFTGDSGGAGDVGSSAIGVRPRDSDTTRLGEQALTANDLEPGTSNLTPPPVFGRRPT
jgi:hypothetical protein